MQQICWPLFAKPSFKTLDFTLIRRWKVKTKWSVYRRPENNSDRALKYFDSYYASVFGSDRWASMRLALLCRKSYCALLNRFSTGNDSTVVDLIDIGAEPLSLLPVKTAFRITSNKNDGGIASEIIVENQQDEFSVGHPPKNEGLESFMPPPPIVTPSDKKREREKHLFMGTGRDGDFRQSDGDDEGFRVKFEPWSTSIDEILSEDLKIFVFPSDEISKFPEPKSTGNGLYSYYLMDLASVFTALVLNPQDDDRILDICAAPGGKSLAMLQCCTPRQLVCVDKSPSRSLRMERTFKAFLPGWLIDDVVEVFSGCDAVSFADHHCASHRRLCDAGPGFDKVLVDVPCLNDRISVSDDDNNWFKPSRNKERLALPETQRDVLVAALRCCAVGGIVVYSTCTLAPGQNDGVVFAALQMAAEQFDIHAVVEDIEPFTSFLIDRNLLTIDQSWSRYGHLVAPILTANFGPAYCCRIRRTA